MKVLILVATLCVAAKALPFPNGTIPKQVTDMFAKFFPNTTLDGIHKALEGSPSTLFNCVSADKQAAFTACRTEALSRHRQRRPGRGGKGGNCSATTESPAEEVTTEAPSGNRAVRSAPFRPPRLQCVPKCFLQKVGLVDADGNVVQTNVTAFIDALNLSADQKTAAKTAFQNCISTNFTLPNITNIAGPPHRFKGPFANLTRPFPPPFDQTCMKSGKALTCLSGAIVQNGCSSAAAKTAAIKWSSSEEYSDEQDYEAESSEEKSTSAKLKQEHHAELNEAANLEEDGSSEHNNGTSSEETGDHNGKKQGPRNSRGRNKQRGGQRGGPKKADGGSSNSTEPQQEAQQSGKAASGRPNRRGNGQRGTGQKNNGTQTAALRAEPLDDEYKNVEDEGSSSDEEGENITEPIQSPLPGTYFRDPAAGRPGISLRG